MTEMTVLDVGHGNSAILRSAGQVAVVDAPTRSLLLDTLRDMAIETVDVAFISHADKDHLAGIVGLLTSKTVRVNTLYLNVDANRRSRLWRDLLAAVAVAQAQGSCKVVTSLSSTTPGRVDVGDARIHVVAPSASLTLTGVGGRTQDDQLVTANSLSAVLRVEHQDERSGVLLAGDMDEIGLKDAVASNTRVPSPRRIPRRGHFQICPSNFGCRSAINRNLLERQKPPREPSAGDCGSDSCGEVRNRLYTDGQELQREISSGRPSRRSSSSWPQGKPLLRRLDHLYSEWRGTPSIKPWGPLRRLRRICSLNSYVPTTNKLTCLCHLH